MGLEWRLEKETREYQKEHGGVGAIEELKIMLLDTKAEQERIRKQNEVSGRDFDRMREEKELERQIQKAVKRKEKIEDAVI